jgi:uncharacterized protein (TIRG00374 family)
MSKKHLIVLLKVLVSAGLIFLVIHKIAPDWRRLGDQIAAAFQHGYLWLLAALLVMSALVAVSAFRWKMVLDGHDIGIRYAEAARLFLMGLFFSQFMPGGLAAGDVVRSYYITCCTTHKKMECVATIIVDRAIGVFGLVTVVVVSLLLGGEYIGRSLWLIAMAVVIGGGIVLFFSKNILRKLPFADWVYERLPYKEHVIRAYEAFRHYRGYKIQLVACWFQSILIQLLLVLAAYCIGRAVGVSATPFQFLLWIPLVGAISALPISFGNVGTAEAGYAFFFMQGQHPEGYNSVVLAFALMMRMLWLCLGIIGGLVWWARKGKIVRNASSTCPREQA